MTAHDENPLPQRPGRAATHRIAVIGGGVAGATAARTLRDHGHSIVIFDKGRGAGGRSSTRRVDEAIHFDHGAQYFTVTDSRFYATVQSWVERGSAARWKARFAEVTAGQVAEAPERARYVGVPGMSQIVAGLLDGLDVRWDHCVSDLVRADDGGWQLTIEDREQEGPFDRVVVALPAPQSAVLLDAVEPALAQRARQAPFDPCWAVMACFERSLALPFDGAKVRNGGPLAWLARNSSKPDRPSTPPDAWILHAAHDWSARHVDLSTKEVCDEAMTALRELCTTVGITLPHPVSLHAHRWRYARATQPCNQPLIESEDRALIMCGDWLLGDRVESAYLSGLAVGEHWGRAHAR